MALMALLGLGYFSGTGAGLNNLSMSAVRVGTEYTWSVAPLFIWMGLLAYYVGFAEELYNAAYKWIGHLPGGLASATTASCAGLAAITGSSLTGVLAMGAISLPQMRAYKYDDKLATACICTAATIGILIPPSLGFIVYGMLTEISIGKLFIAGIFPGILQTGIIIGLITILTIRNPKLGPPGPKTAWREKIASLKSVWAVLLLIVFCIGGIYAGVFTPTEAGAIGSFGALVLGTIRRRLSLKGLVQSMSEATRMTGVIFFIFVFATALTVFLASTNLTYDLAEWVIALDIPPLAIITLILLIYMILGCLMNSLPAVILTLPILFPIVTTAGFDPIWFGVLVVVMVELGQITPPIGMNVFAMAAYAKDIPMYNIFRGVLPFWVAFIIFIILLVAFPQICLFLPSLM
jgi:tripartite ATP-independent transporter DctM subunit